jgi:rSAM/selenodomain-associated transferase 2/rSAM/selenodomain-associated transferase 1
VVKLISFNMKNILSKRKPSLDRIIIFGRYPRPGKVKTRLISALGPAGAAELQRRLTEKTLETVMKVASKRSIDVEFRFDGGREGDLRRWLGTEPAFTGQGPGDLGERMHNAFIDAFRQGCRRIVLLGTDIPELKTDHLREAFSALRDKDLVLGPSTDGGYWLMGLRRPLDLFRGIEWGTGKVLEQTLTLDNGDGLTVFQLEPLRDLDTVEDLRQWRPETATPRPYMSVIIPVLNEAKHIEETIEKIWDKDVEIIVVDGGSTDDTMAKALEAGADVVTSPPGRAKQQNRGAAIARGRVLLFLHADTLLPKGYVSHVFETLLDRKTAVGAFRFKTDGDHWTMKVVELMSDLRSWILKMPYGDQALFVRKPLFESVGGFPDTPIAEDLYLVRRLSKKGKVRIAPASVITSARRWQTLGVLRTSLINVLIATACSLGFSPERFVSLYKNEKLRLHP